MPLVPQVPELADLKETVEAVAEATFNGSLLNRNRGGRDAIGLHSDNEPEEG